MLRLYILNIWSAKMIDTYLYGWLGGQTYIDEQKKIFDDDYDDEGGKEEEE